MRQLYVCTNAFSCKNVFPNASENIPRPRLIGVLRELKRGKSVRRNGKYEFEYLTGGEFKEPCLRLYRLEDPKKIYNNDEIAHLLHHWLPDPNDMMWFKDLLKDAGLKRYDEWEWMKCYGARGSQEYAYLYETLPENIIRYDKL